MLSLAIALSAAGDLLYQYRDETLDPIPYPGWSDISYLESSLAFAVALALLTQVGASEASRLNGLVIGLAAGAVAVTLWFESIFEQTGSTAEVLVSLAYPLFDVVFIVIILSGLATVRLRQSLAVITLMAAIGLFLLGDIVFLRREAVGSYVDGTWLELTWSGGMLLFGLAAWMPRYRSSHSSAAQSMASGAVPWIAATGALGVIAWSGRVDVPELAVWLAIASIAAVFARIGLTLNELRRSNEAFSQAWIGELTGFQDSERSQDSDQAALAPTPPVTAGPTSVWQIASVAIAVTALIGVGVLLWQVASDTTSTDDAAASGDGVQIDEATGDLQGQVDALRLQLREFGLTDVEPELRGSVVYLVGSVPTEADRQTVTTVVDGLSSQLEVNTSELIAEADDAAQVGPDPQNLALQRDLDRLLAFTPIVFESGEVELTELQQRVLNNVGALLLSYSGTTVRVVGYTDDLGSDGSNTQLSEARANAVAEYLISQGVASDDLIVEGRGESRATGSDQLAGLDRRVEFEVVTTGSSIVPPTALRVGIVTPSASNDLAFSQSIVQAMDLLVTERDGMEVAVVDNTFVPEDASAAIRDFAGQGYHLVIVHGSEFGGVLPDIVAEFPEVTFAWGPAADAPALPNLYTYDAASEQGAYVLGALAASLSSTDALGVVGPIQVGDSQRHIEGFRLGAEAEKPSVDVQVAYIGSFLDTSLAAETATSQIDAGADVMTGSGQMVVGAISVAEENNVPWFGNQTDQSPLAPTSVVASQVYHWDVLIRAIIADLDNGARDPRPLTADLSNGGLSIEFNPGYALDPGLRERAEGLVQAISAGEINVTGD